MKSAIYKKTCNICFVLLLVLTVTLWSVFMSGVLQHDRTDDILGSFLTMELGSVVLLVVIVQELIFYKSAKYIFGETTSKTTTKTVCYMLMCLADLALVVFEIISILSYF